MRLAFLAHPNSIHTRRWIGWFAAAGHDVAIVDPVGIDVEPGLPAAVKVLRPRIEVGGLPVIRTLRRRSDLRRVLIELHPDVVHAHYLGRFAWSAALAGVHPLVVSPWGSDLLQVPRGRIRTRLWNRLALRAADLVTVSSEGMRAAAIAAGARADRVRLVHHGVDTARFSPGRPAAAFRARLEVLAGTPIIVSPRTVAPLYRHDVVLDAVAEVGRARTPAPVLVVSARGARPDTLAKLRARADGLGVGDRLRVLPDVAPHELPDLYRLADAVVSVPETDSFAVTLLEAMSCGRPIVASDVPAIRPVLGAIDPAARDLIVPVGDVAATASAIDRALDLEAPVRSRLGAALREHVLTTAEYDTNMALMERLYRLLAGRR